MSFAFRVLAGGLLLAGPAIALAGALVGDHPRRLTRSLQLGALAAVPGIGALVWLHGHPAGTMLGQVTTVLAGLVPGYLFAGWLAVRAGGRTATGNDTAGRTGGDDTGDAVAGGTAVASATPEARREQLAGDRAD